MTLRANRLASRLKKVARVATVVTLMPALLPALTLADTVPTDAENTLASQIAKIDTKIQTDPVLSGDVKPLVTIMRSPDFDWTSAVFGVPTSQATPAEKQVAQTLTPVILPITSFSATTESSASDLVESAVSALQSLNANITTDAAVSFLSSLEQQLAASMFPLLSDTQPTASKLENAFHFAVQADLQSADPAVQAVFANAMQTSATGTSTSTPPATSAPGNSSGAQPSSGSGSAADGGAGGSGTSEGNPSGTGTTPTTGDNIGTASNINTVELTLQLLNSMSSKAATKTFAAAGGTLTARLAGGLAVTLTVPKGALTTKQSVVLRTVSASLALYIMGVNVPHGWKAETAIAWQTVKPARTAVTVRIAGKTIVKGSCLYVYDNGKLRLVAKSNRDGSVQAHLKSPGYLIVAVPTSKPAPKN